MHAWVYYSTTATVRMQFMTTWCMLQQKSWQVGLMIPVLDILKFKLSNTLNHCTKIFWEPFDAVTIIYTFGIPDTSIFAYSSFEPKLY